MSKPKPPINPGLAVVAMFALVIFIGAVTCGKLPFAWLFE